MKIPWFEQASRRRKFMIGVSGGMDSVALLHMLHEAGFRKVIVCHLDHGLRGNSSAGDSKFVSLLAKAMGYGVIVGKSNVRCMMKHTGDSLETAGRTARHAFFADCAKEQRCRTLLLAHHADDQAETVLWNLLRGSLGFRGMSEETEINMAGREMHVVRPLLGVRKNDIRDWMDARRHAWREDASNAVNDVVRNRIRNEAIPLLDDIAKRDVTSVLLRSAETDDTWRNLLDWAKMRASALDPQGRIHLRTFRELPSVLRNAVMADYLRAGGVVQLDRDLLGRCDLLSDVHQPAVVNLPGGRFLKRRQGRIFIDES
ncbi:MAG: tRNA lysidine(34) synthetase TilS [Verrucomicrobiota bacterium]